MTKAENIREFFNNPDNYLTSNVIIELRKIIVADLLGIVRNKRILDVGCGNGEITIDYLKYNQVTFLDISPNMVALVKEKINNEHLQNASFINSEFSSWKPEHKFDVVVCVGVVAHVEDIRKLILYLKELIKDDGIIILQYSAAEKIITMFNCLKNKVLNKESYNYKINTTTTAEMSKIFKSVSLTIIKKIHYIPISPLLSLFSYSTKRKLIKFGYKNRLFSSIGSEVIVCLMNEIQCTSQAAN